MKDDIISRIFNLCSPYSVLAVLTMIHIAQYFLYLNYRDTFPYASIYNFFWLSLNMKSLFA